MPYQVLPSYRYVPTGNCVEIELGAGTLNVRSCPNLPRDRTTASKQANKQARSIDLCLQSRRSVPRAQCGLLRRGGTKFKTELPPTNCQPQSTNRKPQPTNTLEPLCGLRNIKNHRRAVSPRASALPVVPPHSPAATVPAYHPRPHL